METRISCSYWCILVSSKGNIGPKLTCKINRPIIYSLSDPSFKFATKAKACKGVS
jgi:hypothetical protein